MYDICHVGLSWCHKCQLKSLKLKRKKFRLFTFSIRFGSSIETPLFYSILTHTQDIFMIFQIMSCISSEGDEISLDIRSLKKEGNMIVFVL